jgi:hypothetical protein
MVLTSGAIQETLIFEEIDDRARRSASRPESIGAAEDLGKLPRGSASADPSSIWRE